MKFNYTRDDAGRYDTFHLRGTDQEMWEALTKMHPEIAKVGLQVGMNVPHLKRAVAPYQAAALYTLARQHQHSPNRMLEIGTFLGYSAAWIASACPTKKLITLNPTDHEREQAILNLRTWPKVQCRAERSWDYLTIHDDPGAPKYDLVFIDGDHAHVRADLPWLTHVAPGGLLLFHDYSPETATARPCPPVYEAVNELAAHLRPETGVPDILIVDQHQIGMAGFYKRPTDHLSPTSPIVIKDHPLYVSHLERQASAMHNS